MLPSVTEVKNRPVNLSDSLVVFLRHINPFRLFKVKSCSYIFIEYIGFVNNIAYW